MSKKEVLVAMDILELSRANTMVHIAQKRIDKAFGVVKKNCTFRKQEEAIGFEGNEWFKCESPKHPFVNSIYPSCSALHCAKSKGM